MTSSALIVGPYSPDADTLHLWHFNETNAPVLDSVTNGLSLTSLTNGATLSNNSFSGFGTALSIFDGGQNGILATNKDAALAALPLLNGTGDDVLMSYANSVSGAFTYEAIVRIDFNPLLNFGTNSSGGNNRNATMMLITGENDKIGRASCRERV